MSILDPRSPPQTVRIWDAPVRLFHWGIVALLLFSWWTAETDRLDWHRLSGYAILTLVLFRIYWGFAGSTSARFGDFLRGPASFFAYARHLLERGSAPSLGHNPMGGWSVLALLALLLAQTLLGLFSSDTDHLENGPLAELVTYDQSRDAAHLHGLVFNLIYVLVILHIAVVAFYLVYRRENLIGAMVTGRKRVHGPVERPPRFGRNLHAAAALGVAALVVWAIAAFGPKL